MGDPKTAGSIVYSFATPHDRKTKTLYVNVIPRYECTNVCRFCRRVEASLGYPNIYEKNAGASLFLSKTPAVEEIIRQVDASMKKPLLGIFGGTREIAFVGLGEPLMQFDLVCETMRALRNHGFKGRIRIDTNGMVKCINPGIVFGCLEHIELNHARELKKAGLTDIRISVNATNDSDYDALCLPRFKGAFGQPPFGELCRFVKECIEEGINTFTSFLVNFDNGVVRTKSPKEYIDFARSSFGLKPKNVILREYIPPLAE